MAFTSASLSQAQTSPNNAQHSTSPVIQQIGFKVIEVFGILQDCRLNKNRKVVTNTELKQVEQVVMLIQS